MALEIKFDIDIDCDVPECVFFHDTTKEYNAITNPTGYGYPPNYPSLSDIVSTEFFIVDENSKEWSYADSGYLPNADGSSGICLRQENFTNSSETLTFVKGQTYTLYYNLILADSSSEEVYGSFVFACCGAAITSNLATDFTAEEVQGCGSFDFTDTTGAYNADTNTGGYGNPNPSYDDITETEIVIVTNKGTTTITDWKPTAESQTLNINAHTLGFPSDVITDQIVTITYSVYTAGKCRVGYKQSDVLFDCQTVACIAKKSAILLNSACNECGTDEQAEVDYVLQMKYEYEVIKTSADNGDFDCIQGDIEKLYKQCSSNCNGC